MRSISHFFGPYRFSGADGISVDPLSAEFMVDQQDFGAVTVVWIQPLSNQQKRSLRCCVRFLDYIRGYDATKATGAATSIGFLSRITAFDHGHLHGAVLNTVIDLLARRKWNKSLWIAHDRIQQFSRVSALTINFMFGGKRFVVDAPSFLTNPVRSSSLIASPALVVADALHV
ncbi:hypothetical protein Hypma_002356 [Hypsizygus marmoreus]|uniref:Uncharacterized protein n=1 Tax=Hypsizygus marmoreus TaxID=39966 RepID=A0A369J475_HYPMA|nr:hypothetical protein Hypma_002356 [Hypsizygus marmoreus]